MSSSRDARAARRNNATSSSAASDQNPVARYTQPVTYKGTKLPLWSGLVHGECGKLPFIYPSEGIDDDIGRVMNKQPAFTHPRTDWSHHNEDHPIRLSSEDKERELNQKLKDVKHPYYNSSISPVSWTLHATDMWTVFNCITLENYLYGDGVIALLRTATYGLENVITVAPYQLEILGSSIKVNNKWGAQQTPFLPDTYWKVNCRAHLGFTSSLQARRQLYGIRFLIGCIRHEDYMHWTSFIWDSKMGKFYHFDSYLFDQKVRLSNAVLGFREFLAGIGLPFTFTYYQMPISGQPSGWECGLIAAYCVIRTIRGLIGANYAEAVAIHGKMSLLLDNIPHEDAEPSDLLLSDWVLGLDDPGVASRTKISRSLAFIKAFFQQLILMELGVADGQYIQHFNDGTSRLTQIQNHNLISFRRMDTAPDSIEISELYTSEGGYLPIWSSQVTYIPRYTQHRIIPIPNAHQATLHGHFLSWHRARPDINFPGHGYVIRALKARGVDFEHGVPIRRLGDGGSISLLDNDEKAASKNAQGVTKEQKTSLPSDQMDPTSLSQRSGREKTPVTQLSWLALTTPKGPAAIRPSSTYSKRSSTSISSLSSIESPGTPPGIAALLKLAKGAVRLASRSQTRIPV
ncbi:hypothetical protein NW765_017576 [Fusarium oxysporum]|nr:hypothetical protein NW765_017576 [Fusarium oxysporum]